VPLSAEAQAEARLLMHSANNLLKPADGRPVTVPTQDMVLGSYYLTMDRDTEPGSGKLDPETGRIDPKSNPKAFASVEEALLAYDAGVVGMHSLIRVRVKGEYKGEQVSRIIDATVGRIIFNQQIPQNLGFVDREDPEHCLDLEVSFKCDKGKLGKIIDRCIKIYGFAKSAEVLDAIKSMGYKYSTRGALTISVYDMTVPKAKYELVAATEKRVVEIEKQFKRGFITDEERYRAVIDAWNTTNTEVTEAVKKNFDRFNPIWMMSDSGARGSMTQLRQLAGMRGLISSTSGRTIEIPIKANCREGLTVLEYFIASRGGRKGMADTALRTADSGYLTRRLVDVSQDVIVREDDCGSTVGTEVFEIADGGQVIEPFADRMIGRFLLEDVKDAEGNVLVTADHIVTEADAAKIIKAGITSVKIRSILGCRSRVGICAKCYGANLARGDLITIGEPVGIIAAQSIGEPGTQFTMRNFHTGGVAGPDTKDITQGLPRVEELFEARRPKRTAYLAEIDGVISREPGKKGSLEQITISNSELGDVKQYQIPASAGIRVEEGQVVKKGDRLTDGVQSPQDILRILGVDAVHSYLIREVQRVYRANAVDINDKHIEVVLRQMMRKVRVEDSGSTDLLAGSMVDIFDVEDRNEDIAKRTEAGEEGLIAAAVSPVLLGITKASLATDSFMSAASFQETTRVLTEAAIKGKADKLVGLKENVIIGKLIPAGTGIDRYHVEEETAEETEVEGEELLSELPADETEAVAEETAEE
ncbi:MAG: DNA-directed RNA polymerase subunit beta', partial [Clostridia bacterium]|nr:DNA-directed RNA polymerase subunit beta' [Clostridia bacterium]